MTEKVLENEIQVATETTLKKLNFTENQGFLNYKVENGFRTSINLSQTRTKELDGFFSISIYASCSIFEVEKFWNDFKIDVNPKFANKEDEIFYQKWIPNTFLIKPEKEFLKKQFPFIINEFGRFQFELNEHGIENYKNTLEKIVLNILLPYTDKYKSINTLDHILNNKDDSEKPSNFVINEDGLIFRKIIIAKLNNNPKFEQLCDSERVYFNDYIQAGKDPGYEYFGNIPDVFERVYKRLSGK